MVFKLVDDAIAKLAQGAARFKTDPLARGVFSRTDALFYNVLNAPPHPLVLPGRVGEALVRGNRFDDPKRGVGPGRRLKGLSKEDGATVFDYTARTVGAALAGAASGATGAALESIDADEAAREFVADARALYDAGVARRSYPLLATPVGGPVEPFGPEVPLGVRARNAVERKRAGEFVSAPPPVVVTPAPRRKTVEKANHDYREARVRKSDERLARILAGGHPNG